MSSDLGVHISEIVGLGGRNTGHRSRYRGAKPLTAICDPKKSKARRVQKIHNGFHRSKQRFSMTTTTSSHPASTQIAWRPVIWIGGLHLASLLAFVPGTFSWSALAVCLFLHWLTGGIGICMTYHRLLTHRSFATRPKVLEYVLTALGCVRLGGGRGRLGGRPSPAPRPFRRRERYAQPQPRLRLGAHVLVDDPRHHLDPHARVLRAVGSRPEHGPGPSLARQVSTSSSRS